MNNRPAVTLVMVMSADGKTQSPHAWSSPEDRIHFQTIKQRFPVLIMGRKTYEVIRKTVDFDPPPVRIVMTRNPSRFRGSEQAGVLEFTDEPPETLLKRLGAQGIPSVILAGGSMTNTSFLEKKLIDKCILTVEPVILGKGTDLFTDAPQGVTLRQTKRTVLNARGTTVYYSDVSYDHHAR